MSIVIVWKVLWVGRNQQEDVPGFKTCSIIDFADVGKSPLEWLGRRTQKEEGDVLSHLAERSWGMFACG